jgi:Zn-dependent peptidase ImmA (M78 family)
MYLSTEEQAAEAVLAKYWPDRRVPIDAFAIAAAMGASVTDFYDRPESGYLQINPQGGVRIGVNRQDPPARQRFTAAHEIGHWMLGHGNSFRDLASNYSSASDTIVERQANAFAACLLMPRGQVIGLARNSTKSVDEMARTFSVSRVAMEYRLRNLGIIS